MTMSHLKIFITNNYRMIFLSYDGFEVHRFYPCPNLP
ncbi:hypothetical protein CAEBREN_07069 [Caenorhabditis brenneri]|uniref:Uncharacterized protein n=1 Tax=Caenorhabditis brenneri TaxID=135651 RepID=G0NXC4_CAEBE|nr:hypothetical protein CAEBREN_07069 [Caenorhabditis brenneri]